MFTSRPRALWLILLTSISASVYGQQSTAQYVRFLAPLGTTAAPIPGANGSLWTTEFVLTNRSDRFVDVRPYGTTTICNFCDAPGTPPGSTLNAAVGGGSTVRGQFLFVRDSDVGAVNMSLRVRDLSRASQTWGTAIPVVHERLFSANTLSVTDIPVSEEHRLTIRVYGLDGLDPTPVRLRLYGRGSIQFQARPDVLIAERTVVLATDPARTTLNQQARPAFAELAGLDVFGAVSGYERVRLDVQSLSDGKKIWAFVSSTNNDTQHVTILTPLGVPE